MVQPYIIINVPLTAILRIYFISLAHARLIYKTLKALAFLHFPLLL